MSPLVLVPIGLYALVATVGAEIAIDSARKLPIEPKSVTLTESITPSLTIEDMAPTRPNTSALAANAGLADPIVKAAVEKALHMQVEENKQPLVQKASTDEFSINSEENPGKYFPQIYNDDDSGYSAPLGLEDESHDNWMK